ncbi:MAG: hypothetical protein K6U74_02665 [Firmicutes bacterium]|nr:hypothetical protein [Bacillota bacterium]
MKEQSLYYVSGYFTYLDENFTAIIKAKTKKDAKNILISNLNNDYEREFSNDDFEILQVEKLSLPENDGLVTISYTTGEKSLITKF